MSSIPEQGALSKEFLDLIYPTSVQHKNGTVMASLTLEQWLYIYYFKIMSTIHMKKKNHDMVVPGGPGHIWDLVGYPSQ